ncbi:MAG: hydrogenase nickel incorporation protein HypB [Phycisphaerales bacterium]|nr:hydrogenase nickel incorporation protein HypB [Phycisphaerales bacterium]
MNIPIVRRVLEKNNAAAAENRALFDSLDVRCVNILGGAGSGKTALLEAVIPLIKPRAAVFVFEGDLATTRDAQRIAALVVPVVQLLTDGGGHLTAPHVRRAVVRLDLAGGGLLLIENVGNPVCPANFDLGEHARIAVLSVTEGDDKPAKYPLLFQRADLIALTKCDLLTHTDFDIERASRDARRINPTAPIVQMSMRRGDGPARVAAWLIDMIRSNERRTNTKLIHA